jgi:hypothetical protein
MSFETVLPKSSLSRSCAGSVPHSGLDLWHLLYMAGTGKGLQGRARQADRCLSGQPDAASGVVITASCVMTVVMTSVTLVGPWARLGKNAR